MRTFFFVCVTCVVLAILGLVFLETADAQTVTKIKRTVVEGDTVRVNNLIRLTEINNTPSVPPADTAYIYHRDSSLYLIIQDGRIFRMSGAAGGGGGTTFYAKLGASQVSDSMRLADGTGILWTLVGNTFTARADSSSWIPTDADVAARVPQTRQIISGWGILGGDTLNADVTLRADTGTGKIATKTDLDQKAALSHAHATGDITSGVFGVTRGGTGQASLTANAIIIGNGASAVAFLVPAASGQMVHSNGTAFTQGAPGGDLTGTYPSPSVAANAITSAKILDGTIVSTDVADSTLMLVDHVNGVIARRFQLTLGTGDSIKVYVKGATSTWAAIGGFVSGQNFDGGIVGYCKTDTAIFNAEFGQPVANNKIWAIVGKDQ